MIDSPTSPPTPPDQEVTFIGTVWTPWETRADCPRNVLEARARGGHATVELEPFYRAGLMGLERYSHVILLYWMDEAERDVLVQFPRHVSGARGVFSIRSPARPNPIALAVARILDIDAEIGRIAVEQLDCRNGTPLIDIKPYFPSIDSAPDAVVEPRGTDQAW
ncbi:tRNA (N6-threonylcarbamoyladenosine(37)-N6)-methyltransferase TrmO [Chthonobacter rhizosphaerae]|uniref:tRNA (N6-threonylcarbamoyladenosine(37)-N6)-methyltransferase TrmO n=1 Tax=Chthonobacter rhizosphaerae TaxID=2735553 RepID=UPI0015EF8BC2|nr:tRNA (N6-threonylcarbamoyladenosine(37)-N6)-methyltransferase TrmO [Chthonobacter rhizosphaerae]